ncbi:MAG: IS1634 family transposase, partial [Rhodospirillales bacterium]
MIDDGVAVPLTIPRQKGETQLAVKEVKIASRRYILCRNEDEAIKDARARQEILDGLAKKLAQGDKALIACTKWTPCVNAGFRRFLKKPAGEGFAIDPAKVEADARFDGLFVLRTNTKLKPLQVVLRYRNLLAVEDSFKTAKALLATRPTFHRTDAAIRGHVFCSFLALVLRKDLMDRLATRRGGPLEWARIVTDLVDLS